MLRHGQALLLCTDNSIQVGFFWAVRRVIDALRVERQVIQGRLLRQANGVRSGLKIFHPGPPTIAAIKRCHDAGAQFKATARARGLELPCVLLCTVYGVAHSLNVLSLGFVDAVHGSGQLLRGLTQHRVHHGCARTPPHGKCTRGDAIDGFRRRGPAPPGMRRSSKNQHTEDSRDFTALYFIDDAPF